jgi:hypothetical protein
MDNIEKPLKDKQFSAIKSVLASDDYIEFHNDS